VLVQNGLDIEQPVLGAFPQNPLLSGVAMIGSEQNGRHILHNDPDILYLGSFPNPNIPAAEQQTACSRFADMYNKGGAKCNVVEDIVWNRWRKLVWNASFNTVCALLNLDSGRVQDAGAVDTLIRPAMDEIVLLAAAAGYALPPNIQDQMLAVTPRELFFKPSMQQDAIKQRPMEVEVILGNPLHRTTQFGVEAPTLTTLYRLLSAKQWAIRNSS
jgi:2-dehydropantoate 2-reductase